MKILGYFIIILGIVLVSACSNDNNGSENNNQDNLIPADVVKNPVSLDDQNPSTDNLPVFDIAEKVHDFGVIIQGEQVTHVYKFKNTGKSDLVISNVKASCGCTVPTYDKEPIKPGETGKIEIVFNSTGRSGKQHKTITVLANTQPNKIELGFTADVVVPENK
ncbi:MAG: DUF1573 domain-containing protein [Marinilabiliales bacterium]